MNVSLNESDRQMVLLALAVLSLRRPGFFFALAEIADQLDGGDMFMELRKCNSDVEPMEPFPPGRAGGS